MKSRHDSVAASRYDAAMIEAFTAPGRFFRGNIHTHSTRSDGRKPPEEVCRIYREAGYDFLCLSDHFLPQYGFPIVDTTPYRTNAFTTIFGAEIHAPANSHGELWHILAAGLPLDFAPTGAEETGVELAARARAAGAFVGIAHPQWSGLTFADGAAMAPHAHAVEIYNQTTVSAAG
jgi:predicted metal-dependent phosphoesterase TrpH